MFHLKTTLQALRKKNNRDKVKKDQLMIGNQKLNGKMSTTMRI